MASTFYYLCTVLDGFSRFIVAWDVRRAMQEADAEIVLQRWPGEVGDADTLFDDVAAPPPGTSEVAQDQAGEFLREQSTFGLSSRQSIAPFWRRVSANGLQVGYTRERPVLALRDELKLTDDQVKELETIAATTQEQVKTKLTAEQLAALQPVAATPSSMMQMCQSMHSMTGKKMTGMMMCPMMSASSSTAAKDQGHSGMVCCPMMSH